MERATQHSLCCIPFLIAGSSSLYLHSGGVHRGLLCQTENTAPPRLPQTKIVLMPLFTMIKQIQHHCARHSYILQLIKLKTFEKDFTLCCAPLVCMIGHSQSPRTMQSHAFHPLCKLVMVLDIAAGSHCPWTFCSGIVEISIFCMPEATACFACKSSGHSLVFHRVSTCRTASSILRKRV